MIAKLQERSPLKQKAVRGLSSLDPCVIQHSSQLGQKRFSFEELNHANIINDVLAENAKKEYFESMDLIKSLMEEKQSAAEEDVNLTQKLCQLKQEMVQIKDEISQVQVSGKQSVETYKQQMEQLNRDHQALVENKEKSIESINKLEQKIAQTKLEVVEQTTVFINRAQIYTKHYEEYKSKVGISSKDQNLCITSSNRESKDTQKL
uniref:Uncharacterized protein n=1 Tax=Timema shepardi TaxID=629360 RepID=A0A7R9FY41_TIMSH|nr:unnamed protein product [Timema shepardi]